MEVGFRKIYFEKRSSRRRVGKRTEEKEKTRPRKGLSAGCPQGGAESVRDVLDEELVRLSQRKKTNAPCKGKHTRGFVGNRCVSSISIFWAGRGSKRCGGRCLR